MRSLGITITLYLVGEDAESAWSHSHTYDLLDDAVEQADMLGQSIFTVEAKIFKSSIKRMESV